VVITDTIATDTSGPGLSWSFHRRRGAEVLKEFFGTDQIGFQDCSVTRPAGSTCADPTPVLRTYTSFSQAADENAYSRVLIGFHFRHATQEGNAYGHKIGARAATLLPPVK
jgi:hypothetical protein